MMSIMSMAGGILLAMGGLAMSGASIVMMREIRERLINAGRNDVVKLLEERLRRRR